MGDEYHEAGVCGGNWWNSSRSYFGSSSLCVSSSNFAWPNDLLDMKSSSRSNNDHESASDESVVLQELPKNHDMLAIALSNSPSSSSHWNHTFIHGNERNESSYPSILQEDLNSSLNYRQESGVDCTELGKNFATITDEDSSSNSFKAVNQDYALGHQTMNPISNDESNQGLSSFSYPSALLQTLLDNDPPSQQPLQQPLFTNNNQSMNFTPSLNYTSNLNEFSPSIPKFQSLLRPSLPKQAPPSNHLPYSNATSLWNTTPSSLNNMRGNLMPSVHTQLLPPTFNDKSSVRKCNNMEEFRDSSSKRSGEEVATAASFKKPRMETVPSPLPTFKVRKEKLGDRITALQQLVSPFGKTDTASVLHEAIDYIKFLHDQVNALSTPYMKNGSTPQHQQLQSCDNVKGEEGTKRNLRSRGLCLVPISTTFPVATESSTDFWTPTFGGTFR